MALEDCYRETDGLKNNSNSADTSKQESMAALTSILTSVEALCQLLDKKKNNENLTYFIRSWSKHSKLSTLFEI